jgi:hypothetical protein
METTRIPLSDKRLQVLSHQIGVGEDNTFT